MKDIKLRCPACKRIFSAKQEDRNAIVACPYCTSQHRIPILKNKDESQIVSGEPKIGDKIEKSSGCGC